MSEGWMAVLPFKGNGLSKTRLQREDSQQLAQQWLTRAVEQCLASPSIAHTWVVSLGDQLELPPGARWMRQQGQGLNQGLQEWAAHHQPQRWLVILPDLPWLTSAELEQLLRSCPTQGIALAPDRHRRGCNALAVRGKSPELVFGTDSFLRFQAQDLAQAVVESCGLANDVDTLEDWNCLACQPR